MKQNEKRRENMFTKVAFKKILGELQSVVLER